MKINCLQENLQKSLSLVNRIVSQRTQLSILTNVLLRAQKSSFSLWATDLEVGIRVEVSASVEVEGEITIPAKTLLEFVSTLPPEKIEIETQKTTLFLKTRNQRATFMGIAATEFPRFGDDKKQGAPLLVLETGGLKRVIRSVVYAAALDDTRPVLNGVLLKNTTKDPEGYIFVATDGYRLSFKKINLGVKETREISLIIPNRVLRELGFLIDKGKEEEQVGVFVAPQQNQIKFRVEENLLVGRLIEGEFPDFEKIIPQGAKTTVIVEREDFLKAVKTAAIFARESANIIRVALKKDGLQISANAPQIGENQSFVEAQVDGEENEIALNSRFLLEFLASVEEKEIVFEMSSPLNPSVFRIKGDDSFFHLIMPIRIQE